MPKKPQLNGYIYRRRIGSARSNVRKQQMILRRIIETGPDRASLYQLISAISVLAFEINEDLEGLLTDFDIPEEEREDP